VQFHLPLAPRGSVFHIFVVSELRQQRLRFGDLGKFRRRRKAFKRWREDAIGLGGAVRALIELR